MPNEKIIYWDSNVFIHRIEKTPDHIDILRNITNSAEKGKVMIVTSSFALCEVAKVHKDAGMKAEEQERLIVDFFQNPYITLRSVDRFVAEKSREILRYKSGIGGKDAVHVATAVFHKVPVMHTYDTKLQSLTGASCLGLLRIVEPEWEDEPEPVSKTELKRKLDAISLFSELEVDVED